MDRLSCAFSPSRSWSLQPAWETGVQGHRRSLLFPAHRAVSGEGGLIAGHLPAVHRSTVELTLPGFFRHRAVHVEDGLPVGIANEERRIVSAIRDHG